MATPAPSQLGSALVVVAILVLIMVRRTYAIATGARYSTTRLFVFASFSTLIFVLFGATTVSVADGTWGSVALALVAPYAAVVVAAAWVAVPYVERRVHFEPRADGQLYYRLPVVVPVLSLVLFLTRLGVEVAVFGLATLASFSLPTSVSSTTLVILIAFDLLYGASVGLLFGRGLGVWKAHEARARASAPLPEGPPSDPRLPGG